MSIQYKEKYQKTVNFLVYFFIQYDCYFPILCRAVLRRNDTSITMVKNSGFKIVLLIILNCLKDWLQ